MSALLLAQKEDPSFAEAVRENLPIPRKKNISPNPGSSSRSFGLPAKSFTSTTVNGVTTSAKPDFSLQPGSATRDHPSDLPNPTRGYDRMDLDEAYKPRNIDPHVAVSAGSNDFGNHYTSTPLVTTPTSGETVRTDGDRLSYLRNRVEFYERKLFEDTSLTEAGHANVKYMIDKCQGEINTLISANAKADRTTPTDTRAIGKMCSGATVTIDFSTNASTVETLKSLEKLQRSHNLKDKHMFPALEYFCKNDEWEDMIRVRAELWKDMSWTDLRNEIQNLFFEDERDRELLVVNKGIENETTIRGGLAKFNQLFLKMGGRTYTGEYLLIAQFMNQLGPTLFKKVNDDIREFGDIRSLSWSLFERIVHKHTNHSTKVMSITPTTKPGKRDTPTNGTDQPAARPPKRPRNERAATTTTPADPPARKERAPCKKCGYNLTKRNGKWNGKHDPKECAPGQPKFGHYMKECTTCKGTNGWHKEDCKDIPNCEVKP